MPNPGKNDSAELPEFLPGPAAVSESDWSCATAADFAVTKTCRLAGLESVTDARQWAADHDPMPVIVVVDTLAAAFEIEAILYELRQSPVALELSPWGYLFSYIKQFSDRPECVLPDRADITMSTHCLRSYIRHVVDAAHRRGAIVLDEQAYNTEPSFPGDDRIEAADLLQVPRGRITEDGVRDNIRVVLRYVAGASGVNGTLAELARAQLWQWVHHDTGVLDSGGIITAALFDQWLAEECAQLAGVDSAAAPSAGALNSAAKLLAERTHADEIAPFLMDEAYRRGE